MDIKLKNIYISERLSRETTAFNAVLYINDVNAGTATNDGHGGATTYQARGEKGWDLIREAENYCLLLPPKTYEDMPGGDAFTIYMDLPRYIDVLVSDYLKKKDLAKQLKNIDKNMQQAILYGVPGKDYSIMQYKLPLAFMFTIKSGLNALEKDIHETVLPSLGAEGKILNTNIPEDIAKILRIPADKMVEKKTLDTSQIRTQGHRKGRKPD